MSVPRIVAEVLTEHVTLEVEGIDQMYLHVYIPGLQREQGVARFFRFQRGNQFVSSALMYPISKAFVAASEAFARQEKIPVITFRKGQLPPARSWWRRLTARAFPWSSLAAHNPEHG
jgi:hypothetical protein